MFENVRADFAREYENYEHRSRASRIFECLWSPGFQAVVGYRLCRWLMLHHVPIVGIIVQRCVEILTGISIASGADIGKGLLIYHFGGVVINEKTVIGEHATLHHGVTIGNTDRRGGSPVIGKNVYIGVGAKVLGEIRIGDNCRIGANAVVITSFPDNSTAVGVPARSPR